MSIQELDGVSEIQVGLDAATELGRFLAVDAEFPYEEEKGGEFNSVLAQWLYSITGFQHDQLRTLSGPDLIFEARKHPLRYSTNIGGVLHRAVYAKLDAYPDMKEQLIACSLPLRVPTTFHSVGVQGQSFSIAEAARLHYFQEFADTNPWATGGNTFHDLLLDLNRRLRKVA